MTPVIKPEIDNNNFAHTLLKLYIYHPFLVFFTRIPTLRNAALL